jgi:glycosyltransferase involved in cell wall biosynthesis
MKLPLIVGFHTHFSGVTDQYSNPFLRGFSRFYFNLADKFLFRFADLVLANSEAMVELAETLGAGRVEVMGTLLPGAALEPPVTPIHDSVERVLFAGRLAPEKRVAWVIEAARALPDITFTIAGEGPLKDDVQRAADELPNLECLGWVSRRALLAEMDKADMLLLPSVVESFGTVALEAMSRQRLALVTPSCGIVEWPDLDSALFKLEDGESLAEAIRRVAELPAETRRSTSRRAREAALALNENSLMHWFGVFEAEEPESERDAH